MKGSVGSEAPIWLIAGPTASGKSALALRLAESIGGELINADSMQVYSDLRVLTARPSKDDLSRRPHHLDGVAKGAEGFSAGAWLRAANAVLDDLERRNVPAVVVGGTGLYFRALTDGISSIPQISAATRDEAVARLERLGEAAFRDELSRADPAAAARIAPGDRQRLTRAFEVFLETGQPLSEWQGRSEGGLKRPWKGVVLAPDRAALYARCDARFAMMMEEGAIEEAASLAAKRLPAGAPVMKALGAPELMRSLAGEISLEAAVALSQQSTRNYAKRQMTWFRNQTTHWPRLHSATSDEQWREFSAITSTLMEQAR